MSFFGGAVVGVVVGLAGGVFLARRRTGPPNPGSSGRGSSGGGSSGRGLPAIVMATLALVASGVALVRSGHDNHTGTTTTDTTTAPTGSSTSTTTTAPAVGAPSTPTTSPPLGATVSVPNVVEMGKDAAVATLGNVGLKATVETLPLANVPAGFVISQSPLPAAQVTAGSSVSLVVSSAS